jgi:hypothetical protein
MANYYATFRSNYFRVRDLTEFKNLCESYNLTVLYEKDGSELVGIASGVDSDDGAMPDMKYNEQSDEFEYADLVGDLYPLLLEGEVAVLMEVGAEKLRYVVGYAIAFNNKGETKELGLNQIYDLAKTLGSNCTVAEY